MWNENEIPLCGSCGHRHVQGVKCSICGHVGKSQIFSRMKGRANEKREYRYKLLSGSECQLEESKFDIVQELRTLMCAEFGKSCDDEFFIDKEHASHHLLVYAGDMPVSVARFSIDSHNNTQVLEIDRFYVMPQYRCRNIAYRTLLIILKITQESVIQAIKLPHLDFEWISYKLTQFGFRSKTAEINSNSEYIFSLVEGSSEKRSAAIAWLETKII